MGFSAAGLALTTKAWWWWGGSTLLRLLGLPAALLTLYLELYGSSPVVASLVVSRLGRRILLFAACTRQYAHDMSAILDLHPTVAAQTPVRQPPPATVASKGARSAKSTNPASLSISTSSVLASVSAPRYTPSVLSSFSSFSSPFSSSSSFATTTMPSHSRAKTISHIDLVGQGKRLSLQFPIQPAAGSVSPKASPPVVRPQSWIGASPASALPAVTSPSEINFFAVIAAQDRYVLELKEELAKAESDLNILKKHYLNHQVYKLRNDISALARPKPSGDATTNTQLDHADDGDLSATIQREADRKKAMLSNVRTPSRKVFSGSRQLRSLSLLSPNKTYSPSFPQPPDLLDPDPIDNQSPVPPRSPVSPHTRKQATEELNDGRFDLASMPNIQREKLIQASTQLAAGFKQGFFNMLGDLRAAAAGEEVVDRNDGTFAPAAATKGASAKSIRKRSDGQPLTSRAANSKVLGSRTGSIGDDFWAENGLSEPKSSVAIKKITSITPAQTPQKQLAKPVDEDEDWITWDTPNDNHNSSDESYEPASPGSSRASVGYHSKRHDSKTSLTMVNTAGHFNDAASDDAKREMTTWSDLTKLSPVNLKQKASHLMREWEKQLTPPPESRTASHAHGDYLGRSSSPPSLI